MLNILQISDLHLHKNANCRNIISDKEEDDWFSYIFLSKQDTNGDDISFFSQTSYDLYALEAMNAKIIELNPDIVMITGDIASSSDQMSKAKNFFVTSEYEDDLLFDPRVSAPILGFLEKSWILPGNHDRIKLPEKASKWISTFIERISFFENDFCEYFLENYKSSNKSNRLSIHEDLNQNIVFIFYDFTLSRDEFNLHMKKKRFSAREIFQYYLGSGMVTNESLDIIETELNRHTDKKCIFVSHYPMSLTDGDNKYLKLFRAKKLKKLLKKYNVNMYISGHTHNTVCTNSNFGYEISCGTSSSCNREGKYSYIQYIFNNSIDVLVKEIIYNSNNKTNEKDPYLVHELVQTEL